MFESDFFLDGALYPTLATYVRRQSALRWGDSLTCWGTYHRRRESLRQLRCAPRHEPYTSQQRSLPLRH